MKKCYRATNDHDWLHHEDLVTCTQDRNMIEFRILIQSSPMGFLFLACLLSLPSPSTPFLSTFLLPSISSSLLPQSNFCNYHKVFTFYPFSVLIPKFCWTHKYIIIVSATSFPIFTFSPMWYSDIISIIGDILYNDYPYRCWMNSDFN